MDVEVLVGKLVKSRHYKIINRVQYIHADWPRRELGILKIPASWGLVYEANPQEQELLVVGWTALAPSLAQALRGLGAEQLYREVDDLDA